MDQKNDLEKLDQLAIGSNQTGTPVLRIGLQMQVFMRGGNRPETRHRAVDVLAGFAKAASVNVTHWQKHMASRLSPLKGQDVGALLHAEVDRVNPETEFYGPHVCDGQVPPRWQGAAMLLPTNSPRKLSTLHLAMPALLAKQDPDDLIARLSAWCAQLGPVHGTAGLAPIYELGMQHSYRDETWPLLSRFTGLDYLDGFIMAPSGEDEIRGVNWLTILGTPILEAIGGVEALSQRLADAAQPFAALGDAAAPVVLPYEGGVIVRAGRLAQLGDRNAAGTPESYRIVAAALRPWLFTAYEGKPTQLLKVPPPLDAYDETIRWATRFDRE